MSSSTRKISMQTLVAAIQAKEIRGDFKDLHIAKISQDSRAVNASSIFVAISGTRTDGHLYIDKAINNGVRMVVLEEFPEEMTDGVCYIRVQNSAKAYAQLAGAFYAYPDRDMTLTGVTGTNGKTSIASFLYQLFSSLGYIVGLISTIEIRIGDTIYESTHTTPDAEVLRSWMYKMREEGCSHVFMEVSSHSLVQHRVFNLDFNLAVFTNLSHDHLDYHGSFKAYRDAKKMLFDDLSKLAIALVNKDDKNGDVMIQNCQASKKRYGIKNMADFKGLVVDNRLEGLQLKFNGQEFYTKVAGYYNAENLLATYASAILLGEDHQEIIQKISSLLPVDGRMDIVRNPGRNITGIVDYAHTPDALKELLATVRSSMNYGQLITIVGCGGDRDKKKRPLMAKISCELSDQTILTSDNPRTEDPNKILEDMLMGVTEDCNASLLSIVDRKQAIRTACRLATENDVIVVAGKGHENYQEINGERFPFNDKEILEKEFTMMHHKN